MEWIPDSNDIVRRASFTEFMTAVQTLKSSGLIDLIVSSRTFDRNHTELVKI